MGCRCGKSSSSASGPSPYAAQVQRRQERLQAIAQKVAEGEAAKQATETS